MSLSLEEILRARLSDTWSSTSFVKQEARRIVGSAVAHLTAEEMRELSQSTMRAIRRSPQYEGAHKLLIFWSRPKELDTHELIHHALQDGKEVYLPACVPGHKLVFRRLEVPSDEETQSIQTYLQAKPLGLFEPKEDAPALSSKQLSEKSDMQLCLCPGLVYDTHGYRLGYGGGYYDRFISCFGGTTIGYSSDFSCITDLSAFNLVEEHDVCLDYVVQGEEIHKRIS